MYTNDNNSAGSGCAGRGNFDNNNNNFSNIFSNNSIL